MKVYISGPMTGMADFNFPAFFDAEDKLRDLGYEVSNPARDNPKGWTWEQYMRRDIKALMECDALVLLPGWEKSRGAQLEKEIAERLSMPVDRIDSRRPLFVGYRLLEMGGV